MPRTMPSEGSAGTEGTFSTASAEDDLVVEHEVGEGAAHVDPEPVTH